MAPVLTISDAIFAHYVPPRKHAMSFFRILPLPASQVFFYQHVTTITSSCQIGLGVSPSISCFPSAMPRTSNTQGHAQTIDLADTDLQTKLFLKRCLDYAPGGLRYSTTVLDQPGLH
jgi:hypothetical protein